MSAGQGEDEDIDLDVTAPGDEYSTVIPMPGHAPPVRHALSSEQAKAMAEAKRQRSRGRRVVLDQKKQAKIDEGLAAVEDAVNEAVTSHAVDNATVEELADKIVYRYAKIALLGGAAFMPQSLREVTEVAKTWALIAKTEADRRRQRLPNEPAQTPVQDVREALKGYEKSMRDRARQRALGELKEA